MASVRLEYCVECMFLGRALEVAKLLLERFPHKIRSLSLQPGTKGVFTVFLNEEPIFRIGPDGRLPEPEEIARRVAGQLQLPT